MKTATNIRELEGVARTAALLGWFPNVKEELLNFPIDLVPRRFPALLYLPLVTTEMDSTYNTIFEFEHEP